MTRLETKFDLVIQRLDMMLGDHEKRIRDLERRVWTAAGAATGVGGLLGGGIGLLIRIFGG